MISRSVLFTVNSCTVIGKPTKHFMLLYNIASDGIEYRPPHCRLTPLAMEPPRISQETVNPHVNMNHEIPAKI